VWEGSAGDLIIVNQSGDSAAPWLLPVATTALIGVGFLALRTAGYGGKQVALLGDMAWFVAVLTASVAAAIPLYGVPVWLLATVLLVAAVGFLSWWVGESSVASLCSSTVFLTAGLLVSLDAPGVTASALLVTLGATLTVHLGSGDPLVRQLAGAGVAGSVAGSVWTWGTLGGGDATWLALVTLIAVGALAIGRGRLAGDPLGVEVGAAASAVLVTFAGLGTTNADNEATWAAVYLTVAGVAVSVVALARTDRRRLAWIGGLLLATATWVRLADLGVRAPEAYTLPSGLVLTAVGLLHLRRRPDAATVPALAPGLGLCLVPSLLWVLEDPATLRSVLLGLASLALVLTGVRLRWTAPLVVGGAVGALVVLRLAAPFVDASVPRWVLIGAAGAILIATGATWEHRLREARELLGYVRALR